MRQRFSKRLKRQAAEDASQGGPDGRDGVAGDPSAAGMEDIQEKMFHQENEARWERHRRSSEADARGSGDGLSEQGRDYERSLAGLQDADAWVAAALGREGASILNVTVPEWTTPGVSPT